MSDIQRVPPIEEILREVEEWTGTLDKQLTPFSHATRNLLADEMGVVIEETVALWLPLFIQDYFFEKNQQTHLAKRHARERTKAGIDLIARQITKRVMHEFLVWFETHEGGSL